MSSHARRVDQPVAAPRAPRVPIKSSDDAPLAPLADTANLALRLASALVLVCLVIAVAVGLALAAPARDWLSYPFTGIPATPGEAATIFAHNLRALVAICGLLLIVQSPRWGSGDRGQATPHRMVQRLGEALLSAAVVANVVVIGASFGAYGVRMVRAALPHGPLELAAYSLALALYIQGRQRRLPARHIVAVLALATSALAVAAVLETFVNL